ncbi:ABC transporter permease [Wenzhouxiangella sp. XN79A]|uniref:permease-like cell division protein FtsX n=1 Tax=Wenzhouxiangella sp. XN79A TaxID=2724193 RepID=UPI00144AA7F3|nr:permease-like cell division protein FtsX [Wenzhouxiangella sp. XN79A]NKI34454.1 ABC transporter permease [Wenzhouxiangella sp. XN79A]
MSAAKAIRAGFRGWLRRHAYSLLSSIGALVRSPVASGMTIGVLAIALSLPLGLYTALANLSAMNTDLERLESISVFLDAELDEDRARRLASSLSTSPDVLTVDPISPEAGMRELAGATGLDDLELGEVPLPWVLEVTPAREGDVGGLAGRLRALDGIDQVIVDLGWLRRLEALLGVFARLVELVAVLFGLAVLFVIANTIRAEIQSRHEEIEVMALVGATPAWIRRPFLYAGFWLGLFGGLGAWLLVRLGLWLLAGPVRDLGASYGTPASLQAPPAELIAALIIGSGLLGIAGAAVAVSRQLHRINP